MAGGAGGRGLAHPLTRESAPKPGGPVRAANTASARSRALASRSIRGIYASCYVMVQWARVAIAQSSISRTDGSSAGCCPDPSPFSSSRSPARRCGLGELWVPQGTPADRGDFFRSLESYRRTPKPGILVAVLVGAGPHLYRMDIPADRDFRVFDIDMERKAGCHHVARRCRPVSVDEADPIRGLVPAWDLRGLARSPAFVATKPSRSAADCPGCAPGRSAGPQWVITLFSPSRGCATRGRDLRGCRDWRVNREKSKSYGFRPADLIPALSPTGVPGVRSLQLRIDKSVFGAADYPRGQISGYLARCRARLDAYYAEREYGVVRGTRAPGHLNPL